MLMDEYESVWRDRTSSRPAELFGFRFDVGLDPVEVNVERMIHGFRKGSEELEEVWKLALDPETYAQIRSLAAGLTDSPGVFHLEDELWTRVIMDFACAYKQHQLSSVHLLQSLTPLYLARVASFVYETQGLRSAQVEDKIEELCTTFESLKPYLLAHWDAEPVTLPERVPEDSEQRQETRLEV
jgi:hypothetical protein